MGGQSKITLASDPNISADMFVNVSKQIQKFSRNRKYKFWFSSNKAIDKKLQEIPLKEDEWNQIIIKLYQHKLKI